MVEFGSQIQGVQGDEPGEAVMLDSSGQVPGTETEYPLSSTDLKKLAEILKSKEDIDFKVTLSRVSSSSTTNAEYLVFEGNASQGSLAQVQSNNDFVCAVIGTGKYSQAQRATGVTGNFSANGLELCSMGAYFSSSLTISELIFCGGKDLSLKQSLDSNNIGLYTPDIRYSAEPTSTQEA